MKRSTPKSHIPGAQFLHLDRDLSSPITATSGRHPLPDPRVFAQRLGALGAGTGMQIVAYDQGNGAYAARLWWLARWIGHAQVAVLDGGLAAWRAAGLPLETTVRTPHPRSLEVHAGRTRCRRQSAASMSCASGPTRCWSMLAARIVSRVATRPSIQRAGHIPGARNLPFTGNVGGDGRFLPAESLRRRWQVLLGSRPPSALIAMCGSGVTACHNLLALEHAGLGGGRLYAGSWSEWIRDPRRPIATGTY